MIYKQFREIIHDQKFTENQIFLEIGPRFVNNQNVNIVSGVSIGVRYTWREKVSNNVGMICTRWIRKGKGRRAGIINNLKKGEEKRPGQPTQELYFIISREKTVINFL